MPESLCVLLSVSIGFSVAVIDEDGTQQLHITDVKAEGLASAKGTYFFFILTNKFEVCIVLYIQCPES